MTSVHMVPADDPASVESFLRVRKNQLLRGPVAVRVERYDADRLRRDLSLRPRGRPRPPRAGGPPRGRRRRARGTAPTVRLDERAVRPGDGRAARGPTAARPQGALPMPGLRRRAEDQRLSPAARPGPGAAGRTAHRRPGGVSEVRLDLSATLAMPKELSVTAGAVGHLSGTPAPAVASGRQGRTARDLAGMAGNVAAARKAGLDPARLWPGQAGLPGSPSPPRLVAAAGPQRYDLRAGSRPDTHEKRVGAGGSSLFGLESGG